MDQDVVVEASLFAVVVLESEELSADFSGTDGFAVSDTPEPDPSEDLPL